MGEHSIQPSSFLLNKRNFFSSINGINGNEALIKHVTEQASQIKYSFLNEHIGDLETEFTNMFTVLEQRKEESQDNFWFYCYYTATLLEAFYDAYEQASNKKKYTDIKLKIAKHLRGEQEEQGYSEQSFIQSLFDNFLGSIKSFVTAPLSISRIRSYIGFANLMRINWVFTRLTIGEILQFARNLNLIEKLDELLGTHTDIDKIIEGLAIPNDAVNYCSVVFFATRFIINGALLLQHTLLPSEKETMSEKGVGAAAWQRFKYEIYKRHCGFVNDVAWGGVNFLTNYNALVGISGSAAGWIISAFLIFDLCMVVYQTHLARKEYLGKKEQYVLERACYNDKNHEICIGMPEGERLNHIHMLDCQLAELDINWKATESTMCFAGAAAVLLFMGFTASMIVTPQLLVVASFFVSIIAIAMYLSTDSYSKYAKASFYLEPANATNKPQKIAQKEYEKARNEFFFTLAKNTIVPIVLITTFAICWPAAILLTIAYLSAEAVYAYTQHRQSNEISRLSMGC
jgi:hypothetical protein